MLTTNKFGISIRCNLLRVLLDRAAFLLRYQEHPSVTGLSAPLSSQLLSGDAACKQLGQ